MSGRRKITDAGIEWLVNIVTRRRELERQLRLLPTNAEIAAELEVSERRIAEVIRKRLARKPFVVTSLRVNNPR